MAVRDEISVSFLARVLGIDERRVQQLEKQGVLKKRAHGKYDLAASVQGFIVYKLESEMARLIPEETNAGERVKSERARKLKLENDERERTLVQTPNAIMALDAIVGPLPAELAGVPARVTDDIALRRRIEDAIDAVCRGLSDRLDKAAAALREGRDPLASDDEDDA